VARRLVECVPNFSEGRDAEKVEAIVAAVRSVPQIVLLDRELDADHNRSVLTFAGPPEAVVEAAVRGAGKAVELIDLNRHAGVHPRIGAADVIPFVPIEGVTLEDCVRLAERAANEIWQRFQVPAYFYEAAARRLDRVNLENIRRGQFEGLREEVRTNPERLPDVGGPELHLTAGATVVGARKFLIAYNIVLNTPSVEIAKQIAKAIRFSSGGFRYVKAMGVPLASRGLVQVSMNLTDFEQTPVHRVFEAVRTEARRYGVEVVGSEIVGLVPRRALEMAAEFYLLCENFRPELVLENRLADAFGSGLDEFLGALAAPTATPGGGSAAAASGAMAAALGAMVTGLWRPASGLASYGFEADRSFFSAAVQRDAAAFEGVMAAYKKPKAERAPFVEEALHQAALVPLEVAERAARLKVQLAALRNEAPPRFASDVETALGLCDACRQGALANVRINLSGMTDEAFKAMAEERIGG
jgi:glutamate formiminotransferase